MTEKETLILKETQDWVHEKLVVTTGGILSVFVIALKVLQLKKEPIPLSVSWQHSYMTWLMRN